MIPLMSFRRARRSRSVHIYIQRSRSGYESMSLLRSFRWAKRSSSVFVSKEVKVRKWVHESIAVIQKSKEVKVSICIQRSRSGNESMSQLRSLRRARRSRSVFVSRGPGQDMSPWVNCGHSEEQGGQGQYLHLEVQVRIWVQESIAVIQKSKEVKVSICT